MLPARTIAKAITDRTRGWPQWAKYVATFGLGSVTTSFGGPTRGGGY